MRGASLLDRFTAKYIPEPNTGCWLWDGAIGGNDERGYIGGGKQFGFRTLIAHRVAWMLFRGEIPDGIKVLHTCDVPSCVNPEHLFLGSQLDNMRDCACKGRIVRPMLRGDDCPWAVLTSGQVSEIKTRALTTREYADKFLIRIETVNQIQRGEKWAHITPPFVVDRPKRKQTQKQIANAAYMRAWNAKRRAK